MEVREMIFRIILALLIGGIIGWEREKSHHPAGFRTHMLVCTGAAIVMITSFEIYNMFKGQTNLDPARLGAQVISGIGFLGAGTIIRDGFSITGLTTAATLWAVACIGLAIGSGVYTVGVLGGVLIIFILTILNSVEKKLMAYSRFSANIKIKCKDVGVVISSLNADMKKNDFYLNNIYIEEDDGIYEIIFSIISKKRKRDINMADLVMQYSKIETVKSVNFVDY